MTINEVAGEFKQSLGNIVRAEIDYFKGYWAYSMLNHWNYRIRHQREGVIERDQLIDTDLYDSSGNYAHGVNSPHVLVDIPLFMVAIGGIESYRALQRIYRIIKN